MADAANLERLDLALRNLEADVIAVPSLSLEHLHKGHAVHFRCKHPEASGMRVDVMSKMRGVDDFELLWQRRTTLQGDDGTIYELMSLPDLVQAKKTQRDKDWPMIRRLMEADHAACRTEPTPRQIRFWLKEARTPTLLIDLAGTNPEAARTVLAEGRMVMRPALERNESKVESLLAAEEREQRMADKAYWEPLRKELEEMRRQS